MQTASVKPEFSNAFPSEFNVLIRQLGECPQEKHENGYYLVSDVWGTCFHRIATKKDRFEVKPFADKQVYRTYTKVPVSALPNTYHVVVNFTNQPFTVVTEGEDDLPKRYRIVGLHDPIRHVSKEYYTQSFLVYTLNQFSIKPIESLVDRGLWIENKDGVYTRPSSVLPFDCNFIDQF